MIFDRLFAAREVTPVNPERTRLSLVGPSGVGGIPITEQTALTFSALFACVRVISETMMVLPWQTVARVPGQKRRQATDHPAYSLLAEAPNEEQTSADFIQAEMMKALLWGNAPSEIERSRRGDPLAIWPFEPNTCQLRRDERTGRLYYEIWQNGDRVRLEPDRVLHLKGPSLDGLVGLSIVGLARETVGAGLAQQRFATSFYNSGALFSGVIQGRDGAQAIKSLSETGVANLLESFRKRFGGVSAKYKVAYLDPGYEFKSVSMPLKDAEFVATRNWTANDACRWYRVPPHKIAQLDRSTNNNIEHQGKEFVDDCILPWARRLELEADRKLIGTGMGIHTRFDLRALLRGDSAARGEYYQSMFQTGSINPNEIREFEDMDSMGPEGDAYFIPVNMSTIERAIDGTAAAPAAAPGQEPVAPGKKPKAPNAPPSKDDAEEEEENEDA